MMTRFFCANSAYSLYQYLLLFPDQIDQTLFVMGPALKEADVPHKITFDLPKDESQTDLFQNVFLSKLETALNGKNVPGYVNLSTPLTASLPDRYAVSPLSDGLSDLTFFPKYLADDRFDRCYGTRLENGLDEGHPKLSLLDLKKAWLEKSSEQKQKIASIFGLDEQDLAVLKTKSVVLVTQPLSEDGIVSEAEKKRLYQGIIASYPAGSVVIKPHPREKTNWAEVSSESPVISRRVPAELLSSVIDMKKVCTFFSTAAFGMTAPENIDIYAKDFSKLYFSHPGEKMGLMPYVDIEKAYGHLPFNWKKLPDSHFYRSAQVRPFVKDHVAEI